MIKLILFQTVIDYFFENGDPVINTLEFIVFLAILWVAIAIPYMLIQDVIERKKLDKSPLISKKAIVIAKRMPSYGMAGSGYFITFEVDSKERLDFKVEESVYASCIEGDQGELKYKEQKIKKRMEKIFIYFELDN